MFQGIAHLGLESPRAFDRVVIAVLDDIDTMGSIVAGIGRECSTGRLLEDTSAPCPGTKESELVRTKLID